MHVYVFVCDLGLCFVYALCLLGVTHILLPTHPSSHLLVVQAILIGLALNNNPLFKLPAALAAGSKSLHFLHEFLLLFRWHHFLEHIPLYVRIGLTFCTKPILQLGIICVGAKLSFLDVMKLGVLGVPGMCQGQRSKKQKNR